MLKIKYQVCVIVSRRRDLALTDIGYSCGQANVVVVVVVVSVDAPVLVLVIILILL